MRRYAINFSILLFTLAVAAYITTAYFGWVACIAAWVFRDPLQQVVFTFLIMAATVLAILVTIGEIANAKRRGTKELNSKDERV